MIVARAGFADVVDGAAGEIACASGARAPGAQGVVDQGAGRVLLVHDVLRGVAACLGHGDHGASPAAGGEAVEGDVAAVAVLVAPVRSSAAQGAFDQTEPVSPAGPMLLSPRCPGVTAPRGRGAAPAPKGAAGRPTAGGIDETERCSVC